MSGLSRFRDLLYQLILRDLKSRYKQTFFGALWVFGRPLVELGAYILVFGAFLHAPSDGVPYPLFAFSGVVLWSFVAGAISRGSRAVQSESGLVAHAPFPKATLPLAAIAGALIDSLLAAVMLALLMAVQHVTPSPSVWLLIPVLLILGILVTGIVLIASALNVFYRDVSQLVDVGVRVWLLLTPVAYAKSVVPAQFKALYDLNPLVGVFDLSRAALLGTGSLDLSVLWYPLAAGIALLLLGVWVFRMTEPYFAESV
ncbi:MAG TPA: ABC transporter permease [Gemmatimonadales bacterium]|nr:ABC transporter permease [Gemmatimonadales bacterium]